MPAKAKPLPSVEVLREHFSYDQNTGLIHRIKQTRCDQVLGAPIGYATCHGYRATRFKGKFIRLHRLAWILQTGEQPPKEIDHINGIKDDNRWCNLRATTRSGNRANCRYSTRKLSGIFERNGRWYANATSDTHRQGLGGYSTEAEAHAAYVAWHLSHYGEFSVYARPSSSDLLSGHSSGQSKRPTTKALHT